MAIGAPLAAVGSPLLPSALPLGSSRLSATGVGRRGVGNSRSGFLRLSRERLEHARDGEAERRPEPKQGKHFSARNLVTHIELPVSRLHWPLSPIKTIWCEHLLNICAARPTPFLWRYVMASAGSARKKGAASALVGLVLLIPTGELLSLLVSLEIPSTIHPTASSSDTAINWRTFALVTVAPDEGRRANCTRA
jgi:hypothetical protein